MTPDFSDCQSLPEKFFFATFDQKQNPKDSSLAFTACGLPHWNGSLEKKMKNELKLILKAVKEKKKPSLFSLHGH